MATTIQDRNAQLLLDRGETEVHGRSTRYRVFTRRHGGFYYLGRAGALRAGMTARASIPVRLKKDAVSP